MAIELKQTLKLSQQLLLTPQLQQAIKLLQLSRAELVETVQKELLENPVLEEDMSFDNMKVENPIATERLSDLNTNQDEMRAKELTPETPERQEFDWVNYVETQNSSYQSESRGFKETPDELPNYENMVSQASTLQDHLEWQIHLSRLSTEEEAACLEIVGNLDENGYLTISLEELELKSRFSLYELEDALFSVQNLDPLGVGCRDLQECLLLQIKDSGPDKKILTDIIQNHLSLIEKRDYPTLAKKLGISLKKTIELAHVIFALEPKPGRPFQNQQIQYITPDVYVHKVGDDFTVVLNEDGLPKLQISKFYKNAILKEAHSHSTGQDAKTKAQDYIQDKLKGALWLIKSIHQRQKTLYKVTKAIVQHQREFFEKGVQHLKPLVLRDIAEEVGSHESTVSRATSNKYVHTPQGIFELKYFFNAGLSHSQGGKDFANEAVKQLVKQMVSQENCKFPLSDQAIADMLKAQSIDIARRTVAKYREMLGILPSSRRKQIY